MSKINNKKYIFVVAVIAIGVITLMFLFNEKDGYEFVDTTDIIAEDKGKSQNVLDEIEEIEKIKIHILGEVNYNGILELENGSRIADAIESAGGLTSMADISKVNLAYILEDGQKLYIPNINDDKDVEYLLSESSSGGKVNINTAKLEELQNIPGVGPSIAQAILDYREENGKFKNIEDIKNVSGVGESKYKKMEEYIKIK